MYVAFCSVAFVCVAILCVMAVALSLYPLSAHMSVIAHILFVLVYVCVDILCAMAVALSLLYPFSASNKKTVFSPLTVIPQY